MKRITEPSTHAGLAGAIAGIAPLLPGPWQPWAGVLSGIFGAIAVALREKGAP